MKNIAPVLGLPALLFMLTCCEKKITIKQQPYAGKISIQGLITPNQKPQVFVNRTVPYFDPKTNTRELTVDNALVTLNDGSNTYRLLPDSAYNFFYCRYDYFYTGTQSIQANKTYTLTVNDHGNAYTAQAVTNQSVVPITSTVYTPTFKDLYGEHEGIIVKYTDKAGEENFYRYEMSRVFNKTVMTANGAAGNCAGGQKFYFKETGRTIYADKNVDGLALSFVLEPAFTHKRNDTAYIRLQSVDKNIFSFYDNLDRQKLAQYNPFVEPVFIVPGQFGEKAIGVFGAYAVSDSVLFVYPE